VFFPAHNPSPATLCGTNCFLVGTGIERIFVEAGDKDNKTLIANLSEYLHTNKVTISKILITHGHHDHLDGLPSLLSSLPNKPEAYKMDHKDLLELKEGMSFDVEGASIKCLHTPGHADDHISFLIDERMLICGDIVLGAPSALINNLDVYLKTLHRVQSLGLEYLFLPHSVSLDEVMVKAEPKLTDYIEYRQSRLRQVLACITESTTKENIYEKVYGDRNLTGGLKIMALINLDL